MSLSWTEIQEIHPHYFCSEKESDWHQHPNGGGWVKNTATAEPGAFVGRQAVIAGLAAVLGLATVEGKAIVEDQACVLGSAEIYDSVRVSDQAVVSGYATVKGLSWIRDRAYVENQAQVSGSIFACDDVHICGTAEVCGKFVLKSDTIVTGGKWTTRPLLILGSVDSVCHVAPGALKIGCEEHRIDYWLDHFEEIGQIHEYTAEGIAEYKEYINLVALRDKQLFGD